MNKMSLEDKRQLEQYLIEQFEWFHRHPELSYEEVETTAKIRELLTEAGIEILPYPLATGLVAVVRGTGKAPDGSRKTLALRCDIDALPIVEEAEIPYASECRGKMHACGHDLHITAGIGAALLLKERSEELCGTIKFIFQPGEEDARGAMKILETDVMDDVERIWDFMRIRRMRSA